MKKAAFTCVLTGFFLVALDVLVALLLTQAEEKGRLTRLVLYLDYGRSVPGKLDRWITNPEFPNELYEKVWRQTVIANSATQFAEAGPASAIRSYGMSFVDNVVNALPQNEMIVDIHSGPGAPPNYTYALFEEDYANRRAGDVVVLGILSSSISGMAALSNRSWAFEQPAPFTYPIYWPDGERGLRRVEPLVGNVEEERSLALDEDFAHAFHRQMSEHDIFYSPLSFGAPVLDRSPFLRLVRRALATGHIAGVKGDFKNAPYPHGEVLRRMITRFAASSRSDRLLPVVLLIQARDPRDVDLLAITKTTLLDNDIPYLATAEHIDLKNPANFLPDGHFTLENDQMLGKQLLDLIHQNQ